MAKQPPQQAVTQKTSISQTAPATPDKASNSKKQELNLLVLVGAPLAVIAISFTVGYDFIMNFVITNPAKIQRSGSNYTIRAKENPNIQDKQLNSELFQHVKVLDPKIPTDLAQLIKLYPGEDLRTDIDYLVLKKNPVAHGYVENIAINLTPSATLSQKQDHIRIFDNSQVKKFAKVVKTQGRRWF